MIILYLFMFLLGGFSTTSVNTQLTQQYSEKKSRDQYFTIGRGNVYTASDFLSYDFGYYFYDYIKEFESPRTNNLSYNISTNPINYSFTSNDSPLGQVTLGGFSDNLIDFQDKSITGTWGSVFYGDYINYLFGAGTYTLSFYYSGSVPSTCELGYRVNASISDASVGTDTIAYQNYHVGRNSITITTTTSWRLNYLWSQTGSYTDIMLNVGDTALPYEDYFTGVIQPGRYSIYSFSLDKEMVYYNSQYNEYCYHYLLKFYSRTPNDTPLVFSVDSIVIPKLKWEDPQDNIYGGNLFVYSTMTINNSLYIDNKDFIYIENPENTYKPVTQCYLNKIDNTYSESYQDGYDYGFDIGYNRGNQSGYQNGFTDGYAESLEEGTTAATIFSGFMSVGLLPVNVFLKIFEFEVFGISVAGLISGLLTIAIIVIIIRFISGKKQ